MSAFGDLSRRRGNFFSEMGRVEAVQSPKNSLAEKVATKTAKHVAQLKNSIALNVPDSACTNAAYPGVSRLSTRKPT
ncbi:hypothetical protein E4U39_004365 [Claviceps sp. Clav50 group G5]|nr:hypothetical protein E4U39_004365 [Claviceps sp. Clav50 group G5]